MLIGEPLAKFWLLASENIHSALVQLTPALKVIGSWLLSAATGAGMAILHFIVAIIVAGILLANSVVAIKLLALLLKSLLIKRRRFC